MPSKDNRAADISRMNAAPDSWQEAAYEMYGGFHVALSHVVYFGNQVLFDYVKRPVSEVLGLKVGKKGRFHVTKGLQGLKVVGVGFGRTGTYSLTLALEDLGFTTLHTQHLYENDEIFEMWTNSVFQPSINAGQALMGKPDLDLIASFGFQATMDLPMAFYFEQVHERYPDCKFILTTRANSTVWFRSWNVMASSIAQPAKVGSLFFTKINRIFLYLRWLFSVVNKDPKYLTASFPLPAQSEEASIASYEAHNARVRAVIDPHLLLEYNVEQGWAPLCEFLEVKHCPTSPFPKTNSARSLQAQAITATAAPVLIILGVVFLLGMFVSQRLSPFSFSCGWCRRKCGSMLSSVAYTSSSNEKVGKNA